MVQRPRNNEQTVILLREIQNLWDWSNDRLMYSNWERKVEKKVIGLWPRGELNLNFQRDLLDNLMDFRFVCWLILEKSFWLTYQAINCKISIFWRSFTFFWVDYVVDSFRPLKTIKSDKKEGSMPIFPQLISGVGHTEAQIT